jgi:hyperosmotically inducible periplasmic protein
MKRIFMRTGVVALLALLLGAGCTAMGEKSAGEVIDDSTVTAKVKAALTDDETTKARDIKVETYKGVVQLAGFVDTNAEKSRATDVARSVNGVKEVRNDIEVQTQVAERSAGDVVDDGVITAKVKAALIDDPVTKAGQINVDTKGGVVQLQGFVDNNEEKMRATEVASGVSGVQSVRNDLELKQSTK